MIGNLRVACRVQLPITKSHKTPSANEAFTWGEIWPFHRTRWAGREQIV
jgi:hypothetical protein